MQRTLVEAAAREGLTIRYRKKEFSEEELLRYFKGEVWGTDDVCVVPDLVGGKIPAIFAPYSEPLVRAMDGGDEWARASITQLAEFERRLGARDAKSKLTQ